MFLYWICHVINLPELVDCDNLDNGCNGGFFNTAFESIEKLGGLETESDYPYEGRNEQCHFNRSSVQVMIRDYVNISSSEIDMAKWLVEKGPISIALNANAMQVKYNLRGTNSFIFIFFNYGV